MDPNTEGTESIQTQAAEPTDLELIQAARTPTEEPTEVAQEPAGEPVTEQQPTGANGANLPADGVDPVQEELQRLKRIIALDPQKRAQYEAEKYGIQPQAPQPVQEQEQTTQKELSLEDEFAQAFPGEEYDPWSIKHQAFIQKYHLRPAFDYISQTQQVEQEHTQRQQAEQNAKQVENLNKGVQEQFAKGLPIVSELLAAESLNDEQQLLLDTMERKFQQALMEAFPPRQDGAHLKLWSNPDVHKEIVSQVLPSVKNLAQKLGLFDPPKPKPPVNQAMAREAYVEPSNAVPATTGNPFDEALKKDDYASAFAAIRKMK